MTETKDAPALHIKIGPLTISWAALFVHPFKYAARSLTGERPPLLEIVTAVETGEPYRRGHARAIRLWPTRFALMLGWWGDPVVDDEVAENRALYEVVGNKGGSRRFTPVTAIFGEEVSIDERSAPQVPHDEETEDYFEGHEFAIIDLRGEDQKNGSAAS